MADVGRGIDGRAAHVDRDLRRVAGLEGDDGAARRVVQVQHGARVPTVAPGTRGRIAAAKASVGVASRIRQGVDDSASSRSHRSISLVQDRRPTLGSPPPLRAQELDDRTIAGLIHVVRGPALELGPQ